MEHEHSPDEQRVVIFPPSRRDGEATSTVLQRASILCAVYCDGAQAAGAIEKGAAALVLTDTVLGTPASEPIFEVLRAQPAWSDLPVILLCPPNSHSDAMRRAVTAFTNVTLLERPASARTLLSAVQAALRARQRQYDTRQQLAELQRTQESLRGRERQLREADRRKDEFLAMLAHELRNPLAPIRNVSEILPHIGGDSARIQSIAAILQRQITHLTRIVDDLLDVSRVTQGRIELQRAIVDLASVVADAAESVQPLMAERRHTLTVCATPQQVYVHGDKARLVQCVTNLLVNAAKYTVEGGHIQIESRADEEEGCISVLDNGVGITPELLPNIFDLFVQSARSLDRAQGGLGIGLSVVRRLTEMHGGRVTAHSDGVGQGARFEMHLARVAAPSTQTPQAVTQRSAKRRILVVDDNHDAADSLVMILSSEGHAARAAYSAEEALRCVDAHSPEIVLLDIGLPGMNGYEVAALMRAKTVPVRIVALTGYGQPDDVHKAAAAGIDAHLVKPVDLGTLEAVLAAVPRRNGSSDNVVTFDRRHA
jgi:two-component system, sensor histidine kinase